MVMPQQEDDGWTGKKIMIVVTICLTSIFILAGSAMILYGGNKIVGLNIDDKDLASNFQHVNAQFKYTNTWLSCEDIRDKCHAVKDNKCPTAFKYVDNAEVRTQLWEGCQESKYVFRLVSTLTGVWVLVTFVLALAAVMQNKRYLLYSTGVMLCISIAMCFVATSVVTASVSRVSAGAINCAGMSDDLVKSMTDVGLQCYKSEDSSKDDNPMIQLLSAGATFLCGVCFSLVALFATLAVVAGTFSNIVHVRLKAFGRSFGPAPRTDIDDETW
eukprot:GFYU01019244.1.p1 GENE.GFYU01019244.1~~GFYU01019244.1.p1  ORF type:complete len:272 (-),score=54.33 GFYU01019244.1:210-1025(-)